MIFLILVKESSVSLENRNYVGNYKYSGFCSSEEKKFRMPGDKMKLPDDYDVYGPPFKKKNKYMQETEKFDQVVYFFDYIDDVFQKKMSDLLKSLLNEAEKIQEEDPKEFDDPYSPEKLLFYWSNGQAGRDPAKENGNFTKVNPDQLTQYKKDFNVELWKKSFSASKISKIIKTFGWTSSIQPFFLKKLIDKFDFDGNGRLDSREFLFYAIWENYKTYYTCKNHCFKELIESTITPLFTFFDCDRDGYINSENLWEGLKYLKRTKPNYSIYKCEVPNAYNKFYRTHATNDFILKNYNIADGYLNNEEFRKGILLGYWERQVNREGVVDNDSINRKTERWDTNGEKDKDCEELLQMYGHKQ